MDKYSTNFLKEGGYVFDRESIVAISDLIASFTGVEIDANISLADNHNMQALNIETLLADSYVLNRSIERIALSSSSSSGLKEGFPSRYASVTISRPSSAAIDVSIKGDRTSCTALRAELETIIEGRKQWYWWFYFKFPTFWELAIFLAISLAIFIVIAILLISLTSSQFSKDFAWLSVPLTVFGMGALLWLRKKMFPQIVFEIGKSAGVAQSAKMWRQLVLVGFGLSILVSLLSSGLYDLIKKVVGN